MYLRRHKNISEVIISQYKDGIGSWNPSLKSKKDPQPLSADILTWVAPSPVLAWQWDNVRARTTRSLAPDWSNLQSERASYICLQEKEKYKKNKK